MKIFLMTLKRIFKQPLNWVLILIYPVLSAVLISVSNSAPSTDSASDINIQFGVADRDGTMLSQTLVKSLSVRYNVVEVEEDDISAALTDSEVPWVLLIREGYERDVLEGRTPRLEGYSLTVSDVSALGSVTAQNITRSLMLMGTNDGAALAAWEEASAVSVSFVTGDGWELIAFWLAFFGFIAIYTALFLVRALMEDKKNGMPDRLGVLPHSPRKILIGGTMAVFAATEITAALILLVVRLQLGAIPNSLHLFILLSMYNVFTVGLVLAVNSLTKSAAVSSVAITMASTFIAMLGGLFWPLELVPELMRKLAWFSPGYWLSRGINNIKEITFEGFGMPLLFLLGFTVLVILLGGWKHIQPMED